MAEETVRMLYKEIAEALGISNDAARMKAKRAVKNGRWRIIPGNHPNDPVLVELPTEDLAKGERVGGERTKRVQGGANARPNARTDDDGVTAQMVSALTAAQERVKELTDQLSEEKDRHRETSVALATAEAQQSMAALELEQLRETIAALKARLEPRPSWLRKLFTK